MHKAQFAKQVLLLSRSGMLTKGFSPKATGTKAGTNFSPQAIETKACTRLSGLGTELSPRQPRAWCGAYLPASLGPD